MTRPGRLLLPDVLRGTAIICMLIAHAKYLVHLPAAIDLLTDRINNVASPLFAVAMGMGAAIMLARSASRPTALLHNAIRSVIIVALGLWMPSWGSWIAIVLAPLGVTLLVGTVLVLLPRVAQAALAVALAVVADPLNRWMLDQAPISSYAPDGPLASTIKVFFTDPNYRVSNLLPMFLLGSVLFAWGWVARPDRRSCVSMLVAGVALNAVASRWLAGQADPMSGSIPDTLADLGLVLFALGLAGLLIAGPTGRTALEPVALLGTVALSAYVLQVAVVAAMAHLIGRSYPPDAVPQLMALLMVAIIVVAIPVVCVLWAQRFRYGPVEWLIGRATGRYR